MVWPVHFGMWVAWRQWCSGWPSILASSGFDCLTALHG
jgi:hypothetical protein